MNKTSVLFVCLGNICRSPAAEAVFQNLINDKGIANKLMIDWHFRIFELAKLIIYSL